MRGAQEVVEEEEVGDGVAVAVVPRATVQVATVDTVLRLLGYLAAVGVET